MIKSGIERNGNKSVLLGVFNSGYLIALLLFLAGSIKDCSKERDPFAKMVLIS